MRTLILGLLASLVFVSCAPTQPVTPTPTSTLVPEAPATLTAFPTATPTVLAGGLATATTEQRGEGYAIEFIHQASSGFSTMSASAHSCTGLEGFWEGEVQISFTYEDMIFDATGPLEFSGSPGSRHAVGQAELSGSGAAGECTLTSVSDPLKVEVTFDETGESAEIMIGSQGAGMLTFTCPGDPPFSGSLPFAMFWGPEPITVPVTRYADCP